MKIKKILIANRGEIACRVIETARKINIPTLAIYSQADQNARHVRMADQAVSLNGQLSAQTYLNAQKIIDIAKEYGANAIHPGYGFLSENAEFADLCEESGIIFIGPSSAAIRAMGLKDEAKELMIKADVPVVPGYQGENQDEKFLKAQADDIGYPVLIKAVAGGGGKGMRLVEKQDEFLESLASCKREAKSSFGNDHVLIEKYITKPRHVEVQVFGDHHGNVVHLYERDCSLQRRHQKVVEEAPAPGISDKTRTLLGQAAVNAAKSINYNNAGTIEFIMDVSNGSDDAPFYFMEMNTRLQVEHPVTEKITGYDLVQWQIRVAAGETLPATQEEITINGHAFEVRLYAEDAGREFVPQTGKIRAFITPPENDHIRIDTGIEAGDDVTIHYDPMIAKLITWGNDRNEAAQIMADTLSQTVLSGLTTNQEFLGHIFTHDAFLSADVDTGFIARHHDALIPDDYGKADSTDIALLSLYFISGQSDPLCSQPQSPWDIRDNWRSSVPLTRRITWSQATDKTHAIITGSAQSYTISTDDSEHAATLDSLCANKISAKIDGKLMSAHIYRHDNMFSLYRNHKVINIHRHMAGIDDEAQGGNGNIVAGMPGRIIDILVKNGDSVEKDQPLLIMEAMKMEMTIRADCDGIIEKLGVSANDQIGEGELLVSIAANEE